MTTKSWVGGTAPNKLNLVVEPAPRTAANAAALKKYARAVAIAAFGLKVSLPKAPFKMSQSQPETDLPTKAASLFRNLDVFPKVADEARARSASGGATTLSVALCILVLVVTEARLYSSIRTDQTLEVDVSRGGKIAVDFNITFHHLPCSLMSVDSMDISGNWFILQQWL